MKTLTITTLLILGASATNFAQTNRINHFSHSGKSATLAIFKSADNMGCGEALRGEYVPDTTQKIKYIIEEIDTTKSKQKESIEIPKSKPPRMGMSLERKYEQRSSLNKINK